MATHHCTGIHKWVKDPTRTPPHNEIPVLCGTYVVALEDALRQHTGDQDAPERVMRDLVGEMTTGDQT